MPLDYEQVVNRRHVRAARSRSPSVTRRDSFRRRMSAMEDQIVNVVAKAYGPAQQVSRSASMQNLGWGCNYEPLPPSSMARSSSYVPSGGRLRRTQSLSLRPDERPMMGGAPGAHLSVFRTTQQQQSPPNVINDKQHNDVPPQTTTIIPNTVTTAVDHPQHHHHHHHHHQNKVAALEEPHPEDPHHRSQQYDQHHQSQQQQQQQQQRMQEQAEAERHRQMTEAAAYEQQQQQPKTTNPADVQEHQHQQQLVTPAEPTQQQPVVRSTSSNRMTPTRREQMQALLHQTEAEHDQLQRHRFAEFHRENAPNLLTSEREAFGAAAGSGGKQQKDETFLRSGSAIEDQPLRKYDVYSMRTWSYPIWKHLNGRTQFSQFYGGVNQYTPPLMTSDHSSRAYSGYAPLAGEHSYITTTEASYHPYSSPYRRFHSRPSESPWYRDYLGQMSLRHFGGYRPRYANFTARPIWASQY